MSDSQRILIMALISTLIIFTYQTFIRKPVPIDTHDNDIEQTRQLILSDIDDTGSYVAVNHNSNSIRGEADEPVTISTDNLLGSFSLRGALLDNIELLHYKQTKSDDSDNVHILSPKYSDHPYYVSFEWVSSMDGIDLPGDETEWKLDPNGANDAHNINVYWINDRGVRFSISISLDDRYMLLFKQTISNMGDVGIAVAGGAKLVRKNVQDIDKTMMFHQGITAVVKNKLREIDLKDVSKDKNMEHFNNVNWIGFSDKYWLVSFINDGSSNMGANIAKLREMEGGYQISIASNQSYVTKGGSKEFSYRFFVGPKELQMIEDYELQYNIPLFDRAVDFGMLYFITKPMFLLLTYINSIVCNFGFAILILTVIIKMLLYPLTYKSFVNMARIKDLQPEVTAIRERYKDDAMQAQRAIAQLYKSKNVSLLSGFLPLLLQMPVFFSLYKVLYVTIEMRQAPFIWWWQDLSAPDSNYILNLFGLLPWELPKFLMIGLLPILMGLSMYVQQMLNPQPVDQSQMNVMRYFPVFLVFIFASFPSGLVLYWFWSNVLSIVQQWFIQRSVRRSS